MRSKISTESMFLAAICVADMALTVILVHFRLATEQNPLMAACLAKGTATFILVKLLSFVPFIVVAELYRRRNPAFVRAAIRCAIALYLCVYTTALIGANVRL